MGAENFFYDAFDEERLEGPRKADYRTNFQVDRDRVIHSYAFRRLQGKTQVFRPGEYDFYRTRLTHTIEVAQIGRSICAFLKKRSPLLNQNYFIDPDIVEAVCLAHDIGHAPFGHAGERTLNELMSDFGGFEGNAQTLRLIASVIWHGAVPGERVGLNPTRAFLDGVLKYKKTRKQVTTVNPFVYNEQQDIIDFVHREFTAGYELTRSIECQIMDWADDVAFSVGDIIDGSHARFITPAKIGSLGGHSFESPATNELVTALEKDKIATFAARKIGRFIEACELEEVPKEDRPSSNKRYAHKLKIQREIRGEQECLREIASRLVYESPAVQQLEYKAQTLMTQVFNTLNQNYVSPGHRKHHLLNVDVEKAFEHASGTPNRARVLCDYVAGMSDDYIVRTHRRLTDPEFGSIADLV